jgi:hypothetical protein
LDARHVPPVPFRYCGFLRHRNGFSYRFIDVPGFQTDVKEVTGHEFFDNFFIPVAQASQTDDKPLFVFPDDIEVLDPA